MAQAPIFSAGNAPDTVRVPELDSAAAGFGLARDIGNVAGAVAADRQAQQSTSLELEKIQREGLELRETSSANAQLAQLQNDTDVYAAQQKLETGGAGGAGYADAVGKYWDDGVAKIMGNITSPLVRARMIPQVASGSRVKAEAQVWQAQAGVERATSDAQTAGNIFINRAGREALGGAGLEALDTADQQGARMYDSMPISDDLKTKLLREYATSNRITFNQSTALRDPQAALEQLDDPRFQIVPPKAIDALRDNAIAQQRRLDAEAKAQQSALKTQQGQALEAQQAMLETGAGMPKDWALLSQGYAAIGEQAKAVRAEAKGQEMAATLGYRAETLPQLDQQITTLQGKKAAGGLSMDEATTLNGLTTLRTDQAKRLSKPGGALEQMMFATGKTLAPLNLGDPQAMAQRAADARTAATTYHQIRVEPLTDADLPALKQMYDQGPNGQQHALDAIAQFGDPAAIAGAARQVSNAPEGGPFRVAAAYMLQPGGREVARDILGGAEALKANPKVYSKSQAEAAFKPYALQALQLAPPDMKADTLEAARSLYATRVTRLGHGDYDGSYWQGAVDAALGSYRQNGIKYGGTAKMNNQLVVIPQGWTGDGLFKRLKNATPAEWNTASGGRKPVWPDGSDVTAPQLGALTPVWVGGTNYALRTYAGRLLQAKDGEHYVFDAAKIQWP
ncbi:MAG TPA: hypothetical protein VFW22_16450 [Pseudolabrys sp.]|nr:hypothetical protein [Pseudolabrys sp.]